MSHKICCRCNEKKPVEEFSKRSRSADGLMSACKACDSAQRKQDRPKQLERERRWRAENRERLNATRRARYEKDPTKKLEQNAAWREANADKMKAYSRKSLLKKYGLTEEDYERMTDEQHGVCAICQQEPPDEKPLVVDHCHATARVRGLLCWRCNGALGIIGEDNLTRAIEYLADNEEKTR